MQALSRSSSASVFFVLAVLMVATRYHHLGSLLHLPDASMAVFFLGGLWLRRHALFALLLALAVAVDWASTSLAGNSAFCITVAYGFLPVAYAVLWYAGRAVAGRLQARPAALALVLGVAALAAAFSFTVSNGAFYWLGGRYASPHLAEYLARAWQWGPLFVRTTLAYVAMGLLAFAALARWPRRRLAAAEG